MRAFESTGVRWSGANTARAHGSLVASTASSWCPTSIIQLLTARGQIYFVIINFNSSESTNNMPGQRPILAMSFVASLGITLEVLACTLPKNEGNFWPLLIFIFYLLLPLPMMLSRRVVKETALGTDVGSIKQIRDYSLFLTSGIMISSVALPIILARTPDEKPVVSKVSQNISCIILVVDQDFNKIFFCWSWNQQIAPISCFLVELGNVLCYATIGLFCIYFKPLNGI